MFYTIISGKLLSAELLRAEKSIQSCIIPAGVETGENICQKLPLWFDFW